MDEPKTDSHKQDSEPNNHAPDNARPSERVIQNANAAPHAETPSNPHENPQNQNKPSYWPKIAEAIISWVKHWWDAPRYKSKWTEILTVALTLGIAIAAFWSACIFQRQLTIARRQLELTDRPWVTVDITPNTEWVPGAIVGGPLFFDKDGNGHLTTRVAFRNIGHSVATHVYLRIKAVPLGISDDLFRKPLKEQQALCKGPNQYLTGKARVPDFRRTIFPKEPPQIEFEIGGFETKGITQPPDLRSLKNGKPIILFVVGCVDYDYATSSINHQTGFIYQVNVVNPRHGIQTLMNIPVKRLEFEPWGFGGNYAN